MFNKNTLFNFMYNSILYLPYCLYFFAYLNCHSAKCAPTLERWLINVIKPDGTLFVAQRWSSGCTLGVPQLKTSGFWELQSLLSHKWAVLLFCFSSQTLEVMSNRRQRIYTRPQWRSAFNKNRWKNCNIKAVRISHGEAKSKRGS